MVGQEWVDNQSDGFSVVTRGQSNDNLLTMSTAARAESYTDTMNEARYLSFFGRAEYNYLSRYYADISLRRDASSRFGVDSRWANFWSVGGMWNAKGEKFLKNVDWLTMLNLLLVSELLVTHQFLLMSILHWLLEGRFMVLLMMLI